MSTGHLTCQHLSRSLVVASMLKLMVMRHNKLKLLKMMMQCQNMSKDHCSQIMFQDHSVSNNL